MVSEDVLSVSISQTLKALGDNARKPTFIMRIPSIDYRLIAQIEELYYFLNKSLALAPNNVQTHLIMADVTSVVKLNFPLANKHFKKAVEIAPLGQPAILKELLSNWPVIKKAKRSARALCHI